jgi:hypothetical protein
MIDPVGGMAEKLASLHDEKESISNLLHKKYLQIDNNALNINTPHGVRAYKARWK